jgi:hypothetical protein
LLQHHLTASSPEEINAWCAAWLTQQGYRVIPPDLEETPLELCQRLRISRDVLRRRLKGRWCPPIGTRRSPSGRLVAITSDPVADIFLQTGRRATQQKTRFSVR